MTPEIEEQWFVPAQSASIHDRECNEKMMPSDLNR